MKNERRSGAGSAYSVVAANYDKLNTGVDYPAFADYVDALREKYSLIPGRALALDLACGTGSVTYPLAALGYEMIGVDLSEEMLAAAYAKLGSIGSGAIAPIFLCQDMRSFELYGTVGAVFCCLDSVNCLTGKGELRQCFDLVRNYLDPGGVFVFDVNTPWRFDHILDGREYTLEADGVFCAFRGALSKGGLCRFDYTVFDELPDGSWMRGDETQLERRYTRRQIENALDDTGLELCAVCSAFTFDEAKEDDERWFFVARRRIG